jgi:hypothetical protein
MTTTIAFPVGTLINSKMPGGTCGVNGVVADVGWGVLRPYLVEWADGRASYHSESELEGMERLK